MYYLSSIHQENWNNLVSQMLTLEKNITERPESLCQYQDRYKQLVGCVQCLIDDFFREKLTFFSSIFNPRKLFGKAVAIKAIRGYEERVLEKINRAVHNSKLPYQLHRISSYLVKPLPPVDVEKGEIKIAFYNILTQFYDAQVLLKKHVLRNSFCEKYLWKNRQAPIVQLILNDLPDVMGFCEANLTQIRDLRRELAGYSILGFDSETCQFIEEQELTTTRLKELLYRGEFVGCIYKTARLWLQNAFCYELPSGTTYKRILVQANFIDAITQKTFAILNSHFDHESLDSVQQSGEIERACIDELERKNIAWFSLGDRNWWSAPNWPLGEDEALAHSYINEPHIVDIRDETEQGHFGPLGTYPSYNKEGYDSYPILHIEGQKILHAPTLDVGFRSKNLTQGICSYTLTGEFSSQTNTLISSITESKIEERNFASDHFYIGTIARINTT